jgi:RNA polymerase primary sigma factor
MVITTTEEREQTIDDGLDWLAKTAREWYGTPTAPRTREGRRARDARQKRLAERAKTDRKARDALVIELLPLVMWQAKKQLGLGVDFEDLIQEGMLGVAEAIEGYTPRPGASFATYAAHWSHGRMRRAIANQGRAIRVPQYRGDKAGKMREARERAQYELGRVPTDHEVAQAWGVPVEEVWRVAAETAHIGSVDVLIEAAEAGEGESEDGEPKQPRGDAGEFLLDPVGKVEPLVMRRLEVERVRQGVREALRTLKSRDRRVIRMRYWRRYPRRVIAERLGITEKAVRYSEERAFKTLWADKKFRELAKFR